MGALLARLWGKTSTKDLLDKITCQLKDIESFNRDTQAWQKKVIGTIIAYFSVLYAIAILFAYYNYYYDPNWQDINSRLKLFAPFLIAPIIIFFLRRILTWWYHRKVRRNETQLAKLKEERTKILEDVMETETYKVAKDLLDKYGPLEQTSKPAKTKLQVNEKNSKITGGGPSPKASTQPSVLQEPGGNNNLRQRRSTSHLPGSSFNTVINQSNSHPGSPYRTLLASNKSSGLVGSEAGSIKAGLQVDNKEVSTLQMSPAPLQKLSLQQGIQRRTPGPPLPRPVLPRERGYMDRVVEYLVGDGPSNRYALICKQCQSHNGMALKEEFEYIAYRCCYCHYWNPARKQRPVAPKLQPPSAYSPSSTDSSSSEEEDTILSKTSRSPPNIVASVHKEYSDNELASSKSVAEDEVSNTIKHNIDKPESTKEIQNDDTHESKTELNTKEAEHESTEATSEDFITQTVQSGEEEMDLT